MDNSINPKLLILHIRNHEKVIFEGEATSVSSINESGPFDILGLHENFICIIKDKLSYRQNKQNVEIKIDSGVMKVNRNKVYIYLGVEALF